MRDAEILMKKLKVIGAAIADQLEQKFVVIVFNYTNYKGEVSARKVTPYKLFFGTTDWHKARQWMADAWDENKGAYRTFAVSDMEFSEEVMDAVPA